MNSDIRKIVREELILHDEYKVLKENVEFHRKKMYGVLTKTEYNDYGDTKLNEIVRKANQSTYTMYKQWHDDAKKELENFEKKYNEN